LLSAKNFFLAILTKQRLLFGTEKQPLKSEISRNYLAESAGAAIPVVSVLAAVSTGAVSSEGANVVVSVAAESSDLFSPPQEERLRVPRTIRPTYITFFIAIDWFWVKIPPLYKKQPKVTQGLKKIFTEL